MPRVYTSAAAPVTASVASPGRGRRGVASYIGAAAAPVGDPGLTAATEVRLVQLDLDRRELLSWDVRVA